MLGPPSPLEDYDPEYDTIVEDDPGYDSLGEDDPGYDRPEDDAPTDDNPGDRNLEDDNPVGDSHVGSPEDVFIIPEDRATTLKTIALRMIAVVGQTLRNVVSPWEDSHE